MFDHGVILHKIELITNFFESIGLEKIQDIPSEDWNLDSSYKFIPTDDNFKINYKNEERKLFSVDVFIVGGIQFVTRSQLDVSVYESIRTDYDLKGKFDKFTILQDEYRNWKIRQLV